MNYGPSYLPSSSSSSSDDETFSHYVEQWEEDMKQWEEEDEILARLYVANNKIMAYFSKEKERSKLISSIPGHLVINHEREDGNSGLYNEYFSDNPTYGVETPPLSSLNRKPIKMKKSKRDIDEVETPPISALNPNPIKKKKSKRDIDEVETPPISPLNPKPIKNEDEDVSPLISNSKSKKKKHEKNCIEQSKDKSPEKKEEGNEPCYLPGQKHDRPNERDLLRIFFETLYQQLPDCELASKWMMEWGLLP
ncbi:uncharacterized protein LOC109823305 [Asparagus officinalis]|uniref:uncharacterized protein LOC109823305 n=1 Tax=Asparagus officinalis TaxID=4686 RepID=UPI00098E4D4E|nr:uncharacterized protein LOC109823305 [Asparagus officinalis]